MIATVCVCVCVRKREQEDLKVQLPLFLHFISLFSSFCYCLTFSSSLSNANTLPLKFTPLFFSVLFCAHCVLSHLSTVNTLTRRSARSFLQSRLFYWFRCFKFSITADPEKCSGRVHHQRQLVFYKQLTAWDFGMGDSRNI